MTQKVSWPKIIAACALLPLAIPLVFLSPTLRGISSVPLSDLTECLPPLVRTLVFSVGTTLVLVPSSFAIAVFTWMHGARRLSHGTVWLVPLLSGGVVWACLWKLMIFHLTWLQGFLESRSPLAFWSFFGIIQIWQFCPAFVFLYWAGLNEVKPQRVRFAEAEGRSLSELVRDVLWPQSRTMTGLLTLFYFSQSFQEYVKLQILFRVSEATNTEFITHHLARYLETYMPANAKEAVLDTLSIGIVIGICGILFAFVASGLTQQAIDLGSHVIATRKSVQHKPQSLAWNPLKSRRIFSVLAVAVVMPVFAVMTVRWNTDSEVVELCCVALIASLLCASITTLIALSSAIGLRLGWPHLFTNDGRGIAFLSVVALCQYFIPSLCISLLAFRWFSVLGPSVPGSISTVVVWFSGEFLWAYPLLTIFLVQSNARVAAQEITYMRLFGASSLEIARDSFWKRLRFDYALLFAFGLCVIFTEGTFNSITSSWSPWTPSITTELVHLADGRAASFSTMAMLCAAALCPVFATVLVLTAGLRRRRHLLGRTQDA